MGNSFIISSLGNSGSSLYGLPYTKENYVLLTNKVIEIFKEIIDNNRSKYNEFDFMYGGGVGSDHVFYMAYRRFQEELPDAYSDLKFKISILYPFQNFKKNADKNVKAVLREQMENVDEVNYLHERQYMSLSDVVARDRLLCERANTIIAILNPFNTLAGSHRAVTLSKNKGIKIYIINPNDFKNLKVNKPEGGNLNGVTTLDKYRKTDTR